MGGFKIHIDADRAFAKLRTVPLTVRTIAQAELDTFGLHTSTDAKKGAPVDEGRLRGSISYKLNGLEVTLTVGVEYAAFLEFGTKAFAASYVATLPSNWRDYAATFKGAGGGGSLDEFLLVIMEWVRRKGITGTYSVKTQRRTGNRSARNFEDAEAAYSIALSILRKGVKPQPYLYPAVNKNYPILIANLKRALGIK